jgi:hypothetical protein
LNFAPVTARIELFRATCPCCKARVTASAPADMPQGTPFGPGIASMIAYLHGCQASSTRRCSRMPVRSAAAGQTSPAPPSLRTTIVSKESCDRLLALKPTDPQGRKLRDAVDLDCRGRPFVFLERR